MAGGQLTLDGAWAGTTATYTSGRAIEFVATFGAAANQHGGFGVDYNTSANWAMFSTFNTTDTLYARSNNGTMTNTSLGTAYVGSPHLYRIEWNASNVVFYIDGTQVATQPVTISTNMRPLFSDLVVSGPSLTVDWAHMTPYNGPCTYTSRVFDAGEMVTWDTLSWTSEVPTGTGLSLSYSIGDTPTPDGSWSAFVTVGSSPAALGGSSQYIQYKADFSATDTTHTPVLEDLSFTDHPGADTTPPTITDRSPAADASGVPLDTDVTVTFDEPMNAATITDTTFTLRAQGVGSDLPATVSYEDGVATLDPSADLAPSTTYDVTVAASVADLVGNTLGADDTWSFTTAAQILSLTDTTVADFNAGTVGACTVDDSVGNGALRLPGTIEENFSGTTLPAGWSGYKWPDGNGSGTWTVAGGSVSLDGVSVRNDTLYDPGTRLEFVATFQAGNFEHVGFGGGDVTYNQGPIAMFSTRTGVDTLYTSLYISGTYYDVPLANSATLLGSAHTYRIDWKVDGFDFYVDGALVSSRTDVVTEQMRVAASEFNAGGVSLSVDWMSLTPYISPCTFESRVFDAGQAVNWSDLSSVGSAPTGTSVSFETRSGNTSAPDETWSAWEAVNSPIASPDGQYLQYRATLSASDPAQTPVLESVTVNYSAIPNAVPVAADDNYSTNEDTVLHVAAPGVLDNDTDADLDPLSAVKVTDPAHGAVTLNADGSFTYTPETGFSGEDSFTYKANDGTADSNEATVTITVEATHLCVNVGGTDGCYASIQAAIDAATQGDTISVYPGTYDQDEANGRDPDTGGSGANDFNIFVDKGLTLQGVDGSGDPITSSAGVLAQVIAKRDLPSFGEDAIFVQADHVTITGLKIVGRVTENNKTIEVVGDDFVLKDSQVYAMDGVAAVYMDDRHYDAGTDTSHVQAYLIDGNLLDGGGLFGSGLRFSSGAGWSGPVSGRVISNNTFQAVLDGIEFVGPQADPWDVYPVGAATITGNNFTAADRRHIIAWGTYAGGLGYGALDWNDILSSNTFDKAVTVRTPADEMRTWDCPGCGSAGDILNIVGIYSGDSTVCHRSGGASWRYDQRGGRHLRRARGRGQAAHPEWCGRWLIHPRCELLQHGWQCDQHHGADRGHQDRRL